ncbi:MAG TPA: uridine kinase [Candidatus Hydrogenedentes bacterium]|nr:uridine kinase [Candidatus Hydrogenedentota bacterium]
MTAPFLLGIAGPSCSGKSTLAHETARAFADLNPLVLSLDAYYRDLAHLPPGERARVNFDHPDALEHELLEAHLRALAAGGEISEPVYDFTAHTRAGARPLRADGALVLVEGVLALHYPGLRAQYHDATALRRRIARDTRERGRTGESVRRQYEETVRPMADRWCRPTRAHAGLVLDGALPVPENAARIAAWLRQRAGSGGA